jgi:hypothetical protein
MSIPLTIVKFPVCALDRCIYVDVYIHTYNVLYIDVYIYMHIMNVIWGLFGRTSGRGRGQESNEG